LAHGVAEGVANRVLGSKLGPKKYEVTGEWRRLHNEEHYDLYCLRYIGLLIKTRMRLARHVARMEDRLGVHRILVGSPEKK